MPKRPAQQFKVNDAVHDVGQPWRGGRIKKILKTRIHVFFYTGGPQELVSYDKAHQQFLRRE